MNDRAPAFSQALKPTENTVGSRIRFECKVEGRPKPTVVWKKDGKVVSASSRVRVMEVYGTHSLVISRSEKTDSGIYSITASNHVGSDTCSAQLQLQDMSTSRGSSSSQLSSYNHTGSGRSSPSTSNLSSPSMSPKMARTGITSRLVSGNSSPWANAVKTSNAGPPPRRRGPGFILRPRPQSAGIGESLCLKCTLLGHPKPTVTWEKNGELVDEERTDGHIQTRNDGNDYFLEIEDCRSDDAGKYTVSARNSLGKQTASVDVTIEGAASSGKTTTTTSKAKANGSLPKSNHLTSTNNNDSNSTTARHHNTSALPSDDDRRPARVNDLVIPSNLKPDDSKDSPTSSISSTVSSHSRFSTSSSRSNVSAKHEQTEAAVQEDVVSEQTTYKSQGRPASLRRSNFVAPTFNRRLSSTQVMEGEELLLQCEVSGEPEPDLKWLRNGKEVGVDEDEVFTSFRNGIARLRLRDLQSSHAGEYICKAMNGAGSVQCSSRVTVKVKPVVTRPRFTKPLHDVRVTEGETLTLEAEVEGSPSPEILWSLDGEEISVADCSYNKNVATMIYRKVTSACSGQYMCSAMNSGGEDSVACRVRVKQKNTNITPEFTAPLNDVVVIENDDVCLRCMVTGIPEPKVRWMFDNESLEAEEGIDITYQDGVAALTLEQATDDDTGTYTCLAVNSEGQAQTKCRVTVKAEKKPEKKSLPPSPPKFESSFEEYIRSQEGDTLSLECRVSGNPEPEVKWTSGDGPVENAETSFEAGVAKIVISPITSSHSGHIKCSLHNSAGKAHHEARVYVRSKRVAPSFDSLLPPSVEVSEGAEASFECKVTGHPQPRVTWTRDGRSLSILTTETAYEEGVASVRIRKAGPREGGKYVCTVRNLSGEAQSVCEVKVTGKKAEEPKKPATSAPAFTKNLVDQKLNDGQDIKLVCDVTGIPEPEIAWYVDNQRLEAEDGDASFKGGVAMMILEDAMPEDSGKYKCVASNSAGKAETSCQVTVSEPVKKEPEKPEKPKNKEPSFAVQLEDKTIKEGDDIVLKCKVTGEPRPKITWLIDGEELTEAEINYKEDGSIDLLLPEALPEDEGVYTCIAENPLKRVMCSCKVTIDVPPKQSRRQMQAQETPPPPQQNQYEVTSPPRSDIKTAPTFVDGLSDVTVADGSTSFQLSCTVEGNPPPSAKWFIEDEEIEAGDDFKFASKGNERLLSFAEVFPEDTGTYSCVIKNEAGEARSSCKVTVEEIDGMAPSFLVKPKQVNTNGGSKAVFSCRVDGDPVPTVQWLFCNRPIEDSERVIVTEGDQTNNYTHSLEIPSVSPEDAGRYSACCSNLLGNVTCTVSLIVADAKRQESNTDFRTLLRKTDQTKVTSPKSSTSDEQVDFRHLLRRTSAEADLGKHGSTSSDDAGDDPTLNYKEVLTTSVRTKALTEEERKLQRAEQVDFRSKLVRKVETTQEQRSKHGPSQKDFRDEALKTKVQTKALNQDDYKIMHGEQKDFRAETIKSKVVTKAYNEDLVKRKRPEQVDFRKILSPTKKDEEERRTQEETNALNISTLPKGKWKKDSTLDNNTIATKRSRQRVVVPERKIQQNGEGDHKKEEPAVAKPEFAKSLEDIEIKNAQPFQLTCHVTGEPRPEVVWFLENEEIKAEADIEITRDGDQCRISFTESIPEDQGSYRCVATNAHGQAESACYVTVLVDGDLAASSQGSIKFTKKKSSLPGSMIKPAEITHGPQDITVIRGNPISLCCQLKGSPPLRVVWRKGKDEIKHSKQCNIESTQISSALTIAKSERDDSGCYTLQVKNGGGVDQFSVSVKVVDVPDPPGKPFAESVRGDDIVVSWYGSGYDGGSPIKSYVLESCKVWDNGGGRKTWTEVATTNSTSHTVHGLERNAAYMFRVSAQNAYGVSKSGPASDIVRNVLPAMENGADSSEDEDESDFVKYEPVAIRQNEKFQNKYEIHEKLGQGRFGKVHRVTDRASGLHYAAKIMRALKVKDKEAVSLEIEIMNKLRHPKLVQLIDAYSHGREVVMVMDLVAGGELFERVIDEDFELTEAACIKYMRQICAGVQFMHTSNIVHLDLKPENIMCINKTGTQIKLIDFGLARKFNPNETIRVMFGTPEFVAPEVINYDAIGYQTDMWSVGVICYILLSGLSPFSGDADSETLSNITAVQWDFEDEAFDQISLDAKDFISKLLVKSLKSRYTVDKALAHKWLKKDTKKMSKSKLNTKNLKRFLARRKWQKTGNAVRALSRLASLARLTPSSNNTGSQRESGFLSALKAQLVRERESEQAPDRRKPEFVQPFDDVEVIVGSAAKFECTVTGVPDPEIIWYKDERPIKESRHFRISYTEDDVCTLLITEATPQDEAEYTCKAMNSEGTVEHRAELIVISPGV